METRRYTFKLYPNKAQTEALEHQAVLCARLWNAALEQREIQWAHECQRNPKGERKGLSFFDQSKDVKFIRSDEPDYAAMSFLTLNQVLQNLDRACQAFIRRAMAGAGKSSGFPKYKSTRSADGIPHGKHGKGWKFHQTGRRISIYAKGVPGLLKARGKFPIEPTEIRTMDLIKRDDSWWASIVVKMDSRRTAGEAPIVIDMNLIDAFASVKNRDNGQCLAGLTVGKFSDLEQITQQDQHGKDTRPVAGGNLEGDDRPLGAFDRLVRPVAGGNLEGDDRGLLPTAVFDKPVAGGNLEGDDRVCSGAGAHGHAVAGGNLADAIQSEGDRRFKKFSYRWRQNRKRLARLRSKQARRRAHILHNWSARVVEESSCIEVTTPKVSDVTKSAKGTMENPGAAVKTTATINRSILEFAPASAIAMLEYKAAEAGVPIAVRTSSDHPAYIGQDISHIAKLERKARKALKRNMP